MNLQQLEYVLAVYEETNFSFAAEKCFVSQSTLSTMIIKLEEELGIVIFDRKSKPVGVTLEGAAIIEKIKLILASVYDLQEMTKEMKGNLSGKVRVGVIPTVAPFLMPLFLNRFVNTYKEVHLVVQELITESIVERIENRTLDFGIASSPLPSKYTEVISIPLYQEPFMLLDYSGHRHLLPIDIGEIDKQKLWLLAEGHCMRAQIQNLCAENQAQKHWANLDYQAGGMDTLIRLVKKTGGLTLLPYLATLDFNEQERKQLYRFEQPTPQREICLLVHKNFVKKGVLNLFKTEITAAVAPFLKDFKNPATN
ncbi:LysR substrate-binding domain-containing protein [Flavobacterium sp. JP2137]|uniref:LysR substrate-binding domain-containing protein n=1 Tax=Flavobacterium sp. JP2137 TaxID=3414510 RepID=UPI003D2FE494